MFEKAFSSLPSTLISLGITGAFLLLTKNSKENKKPSLFHYALVGIAQTFAIIPGISRSGATIGTSLLLGWEKEKAFEFSFIASIPAIFGATILELKELYSNENLLEILSGFIVAFLVSLFALNILLKIVKRDWFYLFGVYCILISVAGILILFL